MIEQFYKDFIIRDYMDDEVLKELALDDIIDCSLGTNDFIDESFIKKYIAKSDYEINKYPIIEYNLLKEELVKYWSNYTNYPLTSKNIAFGAGVMGMLRNIGEFLINEKTTILGCAPEFPRFVSEVELKKANYEYYSLDEKDNYKFNIDIFLEKINKNYNIVHVENPNNPTGQIINIEDIKKIAKKAQKYNSIVLVDEAYGDYMDNKNSAITLIGEYDNIVVLRSASKYYGLPNHRVGYLFASEEFVKIYDKITIPFSFSDLSASLFRNILKNHKEIDYVKDKVIEINKKIYRTLKPENYLYTSLETPIFTVRSEKYDNLSKELRKKGIIAEDCSTFLNLNSNYARVRIPKEWEKLLSILTKIL